MEQNMKVMTGKGQVTFESDDPANIVTYVEGILLAARDHLGAQTTKIDERIISEGETPELRFVVDDRVLIFISGMTIDQWTSHSCIPYRPAEDALTDQVFH